MDKRAMTSTIGLNGGSCAAPAPGCFGVKGPSDWPVLGAESRASAVCGHRTSEGKCDRQLGRWRDGRPCGAKHCFPVVTVTRTGLREMPQKSQNGCSLSADAFSAECTFM